LIEVWIYHNNYKTLIFHLNSTANMSQEKFAEKTSSYSPP